VLRIRDKNGVKTLEKGQFIEVCDNSGKIIEVIYEISDPTVIKKLTAGDPDLRRYLSMFGLEASAAVKQKLPHD
jgi:hypothetical protein